MREASQLEMWEEEKFIHILLIVSQGRCVKHHYRGSEKGSNLH